MSWLATHFDLTQPGLWTLGSLALALIATHVAWLVTHLAHTRLRLTRVVGSSAMQALAWLIAALYLLLPPLGAWRYGAISPYLLGLSDLDWIDSFQTGGLLAMLVIGLIVFGWLVYRHAHAPDPTAMPASDGRLVRALLSPIDAALAQWHLAFYRATAIAWLTALPAASGHISISVLPPRLIALLVPALNALQGHLQADVLYWGSWLGVGLLLLEAGLNPLIRSALTRPTPEQAWGRPEAILRGLGLAVATTSIFVLSRNLWLCLLCQVVVETAIVGWLPLRAVKQPAS